MTKQVPFKTVASDFVRLVTDTTLFAISALQNVWKKLKLLANEENENETADKT